MPRLGQWGVRIEAQTRVHFCRNAARYHFQNFGSKAHEQFVHERFSLFLLVAALLIGVIQRGAYQVLIFRALRGAKQQ